MNQNMAGSRRQNGLLKDIRNVLFIGGGAALGSLAMAKPANSALPDLEQRIARTINNSHQAYSNIYEFSGNIFSFPDSSKVANARLEFNSGCVANLTASRVHQGKVRKLRIFEPSSYYSIDYIDQEVKVFPLDGPQTDIKTLKTKKEEPLKKELQSFIQCVRDGKLRKVTGQEGLRALELAYSVIEEAEI